MRDASDMLLRDYFATAAMQARLSAIERDAPFGAPANALTWWEQFIQDEAAIAYEIADAMLDAREK